MALTLYAFLHMITWDLKSSSKLKVYDLTLIPSLISVLRLALYPDQGPINRQAYLALTVRNEATVATFVKEVGKA